MHTVKRDHSLPKSVIARGKSNLSTLFSRGHRLKGHSLMMMTTMVDRRQAGPGGPVRVLFTVGKRLVPKAVVRNRIKRLMREAYRLEKPGMEATPAGGGLQETGEEKVTFIAILYRGGRDCIPPLAEFRDQMRVLLRAVDGRVARKAGEDGER